MKKVHNMQPIQQEYNIAEQENGSMDITNNKQKAHLSS
jgi:hypothetical protein